MSLKEYTDEQIFMAWVEVKALWKGGRNQETKNKAKRWFKILDNERKQRENQ